MNNGFKIFCIWLGVLVFRLLPFRPPNFEPLLASIMPISKSSFFGALIFSVASIVCYDAMTVGIGSWTALVIAAYATISVFSYYFFRNREGSPSAFLFFGVVATLFFDATTGVIAGPVLYGQTLSVALIGQIPFTIMHLLSTGVFSLTLSPLLMRWLRKPSTRHAVVLQKKRVIS